jgi:hypothetical protein
VRSLSAVTVFPDPGAKTLLRNASNVTPSSFTDFRSPVLQDDGDIIFAGTRSDSIAGVYKLVGTSTLTTIVDTVGDGFTGGFARSSANENGDIAFMATPTSGGGGGIFFLADGLATSQAERVIGVGDAMFGSTVTSILLAPRGLNDTDQVAYSYGWPTACAASASQACPSRRRSRYCRWARSASCVGIDLVEHPSDAS